MYKFQVRLIVGMIFVLTCMISTTVLAQLGNQRNPDYIGGPWIYTTVPCDNIDCENINSLNLDFLSRYTDRKVAEINFAKGKSQPEEILFLGGRLSWHAGFLGGRGNIFTDNVGDLVEGAELDHSGDYNDVFYGIIVLNVNKSSDVLMQLGYSAYAKVWLNGEVVYDSDKQMWSFEAADMPQRFSAPVKRGKNLLMIKVVEGIGYNLFVNLHTNFTVSYRMRNGKIIHDDILSVDPSATSISTRWASIKQGDNY
ncbi:MAG: hypothetical protein OXD54_01315 [Candidatus Poribacteria bacterium]|nr:hypothetical protein [Candidatus Poribacteria bacterium]